MNFKKLKEDTLVDFNKKAGRVEKALDYISEGNWQELAKFQQKNRQEAPLGRFLNWLKSRFNPESKLPLEGWTTTIKKKYTPIESQPTPLKKVLNNFEQRFFSA